MVINSRVLALCVIVSVCNTAFAQPVAPARVSVAYLTSNPPGIEITQRTLDAWASQTELGASQLERLGIKAGTMDESTLRAIVESGEDNRARRFMDLIDQTLLRSDRALPGNIFWASLSGIDSFMRDAVHFAGINTEQGRQLRENMMNASIQGPQGQEAATLAAKTLTDARHVASKTFRGFRDLILLVRRELERADANSLALVLDVGTTAPQPTLATMTYLTASCPGGERFSVVFRQRRMECAGRSVCRQESIAAATPDGDSERLYKKLLRDDRQSFLSACTLGLSLYVDGVDVQRQIPGRFVSAIAAERAP